MASRKESNELLPFQIGPWLRQLRTERNLILRQVAAAVEMDMAHLSKVELGDRLPTREQASALAHFYGVSPCEMEAARIAGKFLRDLKDHPAASRALEIVQESSAAFGSRRSEELARKSAKSFAKREKAKA